MRLDQDVKQTIQKILKEVHQFAKLQKENQELISGAKSSFLGRVAETPFELDSGTVSSLKPNGLEPEIAKEKKSIQEVLRLLQVHPCYIVRILESGRLTFDEMKKLIKQLFTSNKKSGVLRNNYLLISIFDRMLPAELGVPYS